MGNIDVCRFLSWLKCVGNQTTILMQVCWRIWKTGIIRAFCYQRFYRWPPQIYVWIPFWRKLNVSWHDFHRLIVYYKQIDSILPTLSNNSITCKLCHCYLGDGWLGRYRRWRWLCIYPIVVVIQKLIFIIFQTQILAAQNGYPFRIDYWGAR